jgi:GNAT superfamily N-acetyltransferase
MITIRAVTPDAWSRWRSLRLAALTEAPEAFGSTLAEWTGDGDVEARWRDRLVSVPCNVVAEFDGRPSGMASGTAPVAGTVELISFWVDPQARGRGVGDALIAAVVRWAEEVGAHRVALDVWSSNERAIVAYRRNGFSDDGWSTDPGAPDPERRMVRQLS